MRPSSITTPRRDARSADVDRSRDPVPLTGAQVAALGRAVGRELGWGLRGVGRRVGYWRAHAAAIPDPVVRRAALRALTEKRGYADGAALFWTLPSERDPRLLALLTDFQVTANFLDVASEHAADARGRCGTTLMRAFVDAVDVEADVQGYFADHPWTDDSGYLSTLVHACCRGCAALPGYREARPLLLGEAARAQALEIGHDPDVARRDAALMRFAQREYGADHELRWFELTAGGAAAMTVIALLALAGDRAASDADRRAAVAAYRWVSALSTMLDSYVDQAEDRASGSWCAIDAYGDGALAIDRIATLIDRTLREVGQLRHGQRHAVIVSAMVALFLSRDSARSRDLADATRQLIEAGGALTRGLVPVLRTWRTANGQGAA